MCVKFSGRLCARVSCHFHLVLFYQLPWRTCYEKRIPVNRSPFDLHKCRHGKINRTSFPSPCLPTQSCEGLWRKCCPPWRKRASVCSSWASAVTWTASRASPIRSGRPRMRLCRLSSGPTFTTRVWRSTSTPQEPQVSWSSPQTRARSAH